MNSDETQAYLREHPWFREPYEAAKQLERDIPELTLRPGLSDAEREKLDERIPRGDPPYCWDNTYSTPKTYLDFLKLVGGFEFDRLHLSGESIGVYSSATKSRSGPTMGHMITYQVRYPVKLRLGHCDHGDYLFDTRWNNYILVNHDRTVYFDDCIGMLLHAMWRLRENWEGR